MLLIPPSITAGDSAVWPVAPVPLPDGVTTVGPADGWVLAMALRGPVALDIAGVSNALQGWDIRLTATASANLTAGAYTWAIAVTHAATDERHTIGTGRLVIVPDLAGVSGAYDGRSQAQRALDDCTAALASFKASGGRVRSYKINERHMEFEGIAELLQLQQFWMRRVEAEKAQAAAAAGLSNPRNLYLRFRGNP